MIFLSESGFSGLEDFQDKVKVKTIFGEFGFYPGNPENSGNPDSDKKYNGLRG